ncbi:LytTR family DNA-binding domain-containing protein [Paucibacter sp. B2R-40]|jgi:DNA-binding LytR/AlgR family response regulator|uniref:LytR/AlgR family response regulator transcription factor n=1 Tax=Paucibacter sp. B2R-40 TaxID=2893554 RepID=UPI0021E374DF|nr:LytTR family DNA-binding domain-containing protein [Paucibacter sp. B2R-40]MCV2355431.1 LytTR family DNA-binding domain-containing protein [Paucibacter sp. B2R-40]
MNSNTNIAETRPTALIADDEPLLRDSLARSLSVAWPELQILGLARNGREALELFDALQPEIVFLDVHMPGLNGIEAARQLARRAQIVFVTAYEEYAVQAFEQGALDYLVKPVDEARLDDTVSRLKARRAASQAGAPQSTKVLEGVIAQLLERLGQATAPAPGPSTVAETAPKYLQWIRASVGATLKLIPVDDIVYLRSDEKYTLVAWSEGEALIRTPIRELMDQLDPNSFVQVHRSVVVNLHAISHVTRGLNETADVHLKGRLEVLPVSRSYLHLFRQM